MTAIGPQELIARARERVPEIEPPAAWASVQGSNRNPPAKSSTRDDHREPRPLFVDVREPDERAEGHIPGARTVPRGFLELRIEDLAPDRQRPLIVYCAAGSRSLLAARTLLDMGYTHVSSLAGGFAAWKTAGLPWSVEPQLGPEQLRRYGRHLLLPEVGATGQKKLLDARVLLVGAGGLGSPAAFYLAAAGVGRLGIVDHDVVDLTNLQRQILHRTQDVGKKKVDSALRALQDLNPDSEVMPYPERLETTNIDRILDDGYQIVVDGSDNFPTRYLVNDACVARRLPNVHGAIHRFEGQASVFAPHLGGPCYRCLFPEPPPPAAAPNCAQAGVLGALPGLVGTIMAVEALKTILGVGEPLVGRFLQLDARAMETRVLKLGRDPRCATCGRATGESAAEIAQQEG